MSRPRRVSVGAGPPRSHGQSGRVQAHRAGHALELDRADLAEGDAGLAGGLDHRLAHEHLAGSGVVGDPRGDVHGLTVAVALLEDPGTGGAPAGDYGVPAAASGQPPGEMP